MNGLNIESEVILECLAELQLSIVRLKIKELTNEIDKLEKLINNGLGISITGSDSGTLS